jgi:PST family polysaccharide transporter
MLVTTTLSVYYLPRFSEIEDFKQIKKEIIQGYKVVLPIAALCGLSIYLLRDLIVMLLFTTDFAPMRELFGWQMLGDTLKIGSWVLSYLMLGKAMFKLFMVTEVVFSLSYYGLTYVLTQSMGLEGVVVAYALNYGFYWLVMILFIWRREVP